MIEWKTHKTVHGISLSLARGKKVNRRDDIHTTLTWEVAMGEFIAEIYNVIFEN